MNITLVLGAGGAVGWVFHAGVAAALQRELQAPLTDLDLIIGTSAGAAVGGALRSGISPDDIVRSAVRPPTPQERSRLQAELRSTRRTLRPLSPAMVRHALPGGDGAGIALAGLLPPGRYPTSWLEGFPGLATHDRWPDGLWIPAVNADGGAVVVFGRDRSDVEVHQAVEASSAIPGMFRPKAIDGDPFVDGGAASATHADLAIERSPDLVIISSPMTRRAHRPMAALARRRLGQERNRLAHHGIPTVVIQPPPQVNRLARGFPRRNPQVAGEIAAVAADSTRIALHGAAMTGWSPYFAAT